MCVRSEKDLAQIWGQRKTPVAARVFDKEGNKVCLVKFPFREDNREWLRSGRRNKPKWNPASKSWAIPKSWFNEFVHRAMEEWGSVYVIQPYNESEKCSPSCVNAIHHECECSCMGVNHGNKKHGKAISVKEAFSVDRVNGPVACRLMERV